MEILGGKLGTFIKVCLIFLSIIIAFNIYKSYNNTFIVLNKNLTIDSNNKGGNLLKNATNNYSLIDSAENNIVNNNYKDAVDIYKIIDSSKSFSLNIVDLKNALSCSFFIRDTFSFKYFLAKLISKDIGRNFFEINFKNYDYTFLNLILSEFKAKRTEKKSVHIDKYYLRDSLWLLIKNDQNFFCGNSTSDLDFNDLDFQLSSILRSYLSKVENIYELNLDTNDLIKTLPVYSAIVIHLYQKGKTKYINEVLNEMLNKGFLKPDVFCFLTMQNPFNDYGKCYIFGDSCIFYETILDQRSKQDLNNKRSTLGLYSIEYQISKTLFTHGSSNSIKSQNFNIFAPLCVYDGYSKTITEKRIINHERIKNCPDSF
jgi:hypothetical protein